MKDGAGKLVGATDIGGTKIISAVFGPEGDPLGEAVECPTRADRPPEEVLETVAGNIRLACEAAGVTLSGLAALGVGVPTTVRYEAGSIDPSPNLPTMPDYPLAAKLEESLGLQVVLENDAGCFVLGEVARGAARGAVDCCGLTIGTGLGLGVILGGRLLRGAHATAGEIWKCPFDGGIFEARVSGSAISSLYAERIGDTLDGAVIASRARAGDPVAREVFRAFGADLGQGLSWIVNLLDPQVIVVGGSVADSWELFSGPALAVLKRHRIGRNRTRIVRGGLGKLAALYGAAALARES